ncbi:hypothetical protein PRIPAC_86482 [Pristionchus pacificus]|uniref:Uncharacterized protein n=1 Tax=Pristionchus pacificus TaxID=54126 RepID=A0A2A6CBZ4_PRIPA|nr:hypothetical protein PRIPAC_86482 [Pristionchus pacificus]|eukprot:PDM75732.1 hypothetical protein PRIPAC_40111 [Pristionchus pacificus]
MRLSRVPWHLHSVNAFREAAGELARWASFAHSDLLGIMGADALEPGGRRLRFETGFLRPAVKVVEDPSVEKVFKYPTKKKINHQTVHRHLDEAKMTYLEDIVAFIYSRMDEIPKEAPVHQRVFQLRHHIEKGKCSPRGFRKRRAACYHRARYITSPLAAEDYARANNEDGSENVTRPRKTRSPLPKPPPVIMKIHYQPAPIWKYKDRVIRCR